MSCCFFVLFFFLIPQVTRGLVARFLQRSRRNLSLSSEHTGSTVPGPKRRGGAEGTVANHPPLEQVGQIVMICPIYLLHYCWSYWSVSKFVHDCVTPQVLLTPWTTGRGQPIHHSSGSHRRGHHHSHSDSRHDRHQDSWVPEGIHLRSCGDLSSSSSASLCRLVTPHPPHGSSGALYSESAL